MVDAVFDLDGTLVDSVIICADIINEMLADRQNDRRVSSTDARQFVSLGGPLMMSGLLADACGCPDRDIAEFRQRYVSMPTPPDSLFAGVREGLTTLYENGVRLTICSAKPQNLCEKVLADLDLCGLFSAVVGSKAGVPCKPDPAHLHEVLAAVGGDKARSCFIGDSEVDLALTQQAGVPFILTTYGYGAPGLDTSQAYVVDQFQSVPAIVFDLLSVSPRHPN